MITLGKKNMEVEGIFQSAGLMTFKPMKVSIEAAETPMETTVNLHITIQCEYVPLWKRVYEYCKCIFSGSNS